MKILIPFSGGINSTYSLYRWLTETDAEVLSNDMLDEEFECTEYNLEQSNRIKEIVLFLKAETRDFNFQQVNWSKSM